MKNVLCRGLSRLLYVKSLVTLLLTVVFAVQACTGGVSQEFMTVYTVIIAFYFGAQVERAAQPPEGGVDREDAAMPADGK